MSTRYTPPVPAPAPAPQTRGVSVPHLVVGLVLLGIAGSWLLHELDVIGPLQVEWLLPLILVVAGAAGLLASVTRTVTRGVDRGAAADLPDRAEDDGTDPTGTDRKDTDPEDTAVLDRDTP